MKDLGKSLAIGLCGMGICFVTWKTGNVNCLYAFIFVAVIAHIMYDED